MKIRIIAAVNLDNAVGYRGKLLYRQQEDMRRFRLLTLQTCVLMGRSTYESIPKALPNRQTVVLSTTMPDTLSHVRVARTPDAAVEIARQHPSATLCVVGGTRVWEYFLPRADEVCLTRIYAKDTPADTFFPALDLSSFEKTESVYVRSDENNEHAAEFLTYVRRTPSV